MYRFIAVIWNQDDLESARTFNSIRPRLTSTSREWQVAYEGPGALVMHVASSGAPSGAHLLKHNAGVVLGTLFRRCQTSYTAGSRVCFDDSETRQIVRSRGERLIGDYWGSYVALIFDSASHEHHIFRDPTVTAPCYRTSYKGVEIFFSHVDECIRFVPIASAINRNYLVRWLLFSALMTRECGLQDVEDVTGGERLTIRRGCINRSFIWNPIEIASVNAIEKIDEAAAALRATLQNTVDAWASCYRKITHSLSGGLDSSIVAGCLAHAPSRPDVSYVNFSVNVGFGQERLYLPGIDARTADKLRALAGHGDERHYARLVADRWKTRLIEIERNPSMDLARMWNVPLKINPAMYFTTLEVDDAEIELARNSGTQVFFSGQAGDSVLLATTQPLPAIDYAYAHGIRRELWDHLLATSALSRDSIWNVFGKAVRFGLLRRPYRSPASSILAQPTLLAAGLTTALREDDFKNLWTKLAFSLPPGKQNMVNGVASAAYYDFSFHSEKYADHVIPLNSQPVWECMLQIPTYTILAGGVSRGLARRAFKDLLPDEIRRRQTKGTGTPFYQTVVRRNREFLRERLLDGLLVQEGYLDRRRLHEYLAAEEPFVTVNASQILTYLSAEVWLQQWKLLQESTMAATNHRTSDAALHPSSYPHQQHAL